jgi:hypothetical protein
MATSWLQGHYKFNCSQAELQIDYKVFDYNWLHRLIVQDYLCTSWLTTTTNYNWKMNLWLTKNLRLGLQVDKLTLPPELTNDPQAWRPIGGYKLTD